MLKFSERNTLANHPSYPKILDAYNLELKEKGKINNKKFHEQVILKEIPDYPLQTWYSFVKRFRTANGLIASAPNFVPPDAVVTPTAAEAPVVRTMRSNMIATAELIQGILNISADAAKKIIEDPSLLTQKERVELGLKAMKAQDSRIHAVGKLREDNREQERFEKAFDGANYG